MNHQGAKFITRLVSSARPLALRRISGPAVCFVPVAANDRPPLFSSEGFRERKYRLIQSFRNAASIFLMYKDVRGFSIRTFKDDLWETYQQFSTAIDRQDTQKLRKICTETLYQISINPWMRRESPPSKGAERRTEMRREEHLPPRGPERRVELASPTKLIYLLPIDLRGDLKKRIFQVTAQFSYRYPETGAERTTVDNVVFEYDPNTPHPSWRICARVVPSDCYFRAEEDDNITQH